MANRSSCSSSVGGYFLFFAADASLSPSHSIGPQQVSHLQIISSLQHTHPFSVSSPIAVSSPIVRVSSHVGAARPRSKLAHKATSNFDGSRVYDWHVLKHVGNPR